MQKFAHSPPENDPNRWHILDEHTFGVANLAKKIGSKFQADEFCYLLGITHDLGKYTDRWQQYLKDSHAGIRPSKVPHSEYGAVALFKENDPFASLLVLGHHTKILNASDFSVKIKSIPAEIEPDWFGLKKNYTKKHRNYNAMQLRMCFSALIDADRTDTESFYIPAYHFYRKTKTLNESHKDKLQKYFDGFSKKTSHLNTIRDNVKNGCQNKASMRKGFYSFTAPTGVGKTLSAITFAVHHAVNHKMDRIITMMPYTSIIQQNTDVYKNVIGKDDVLEHHSNIIFDEDKHDIKYEKSRKINSQNWNSPVINTTFNQFFDSLFANKPHKIRKLHNIANSVVVIDEPQLLSLDKTHDCILKLKELVRDFGCTVVFCTATPFDYTYWDLDCVELCDDMEQVFEQLKRVEYHFADKDIQDYMKQERQVLCVVNTKSVAAEIFNNVKSENTYHLSANMTPKHRTEVIKKIKECLANDRPCKVISTQLIECGVDLDFPVVLSEICPLPSLIQRAGRCNREGKLDKGHFYIFDAIKMTSPEYKTLSDKTLTYINDRLGDIHKPKVCRAYFKDIHNLKSRNPEFKKHEDKLAFEDSAKFRLIDENTQSIIADCPKELLEELKNKIETKDFINDRLRQQIQSYSVTLYKSKLDKNASKVRPLVNDLPDEFLIWIGEYDRNVGVVLD